MSRYGKLLNKILSGLSDSDIRFDELCNFLIQYGFNERIKGNHHIFYKAGVEELINLQPNGSQAKSYQIKQVRSILVKYKIGDEINE